MEGNIKDVGRMTDETMNEHMTRIRTAMKRGTVFMPGLKMDMSGGLSIIRMGHTGQLQDYLDDEPPLVHGIQEYRTAEFDVRYVNRGPEGRFGRKDEIVCEQIVKYYLLFKEGFSSCKGMKWNHNLSRGGIGMKRIAAYLVDLLILVLLAGCKGGTGESGAQKNKGDIETLGTISVLHAANGGLYLVKVLRNDAEDANVAVSAERLAEGKDISSLSFSSNRRVAGYLRQDGSYGCSTEAGKEELLLNEALSFIPDREEGLHASFRETGTARVHMGREQEEVWKPEPMEDDWIQCEKLTLSPDEKKPAPARRKYADRRKDPGLFLFEQNQGIWMIRMNLEKEKKLGVLIQIIGEGPPFFEWMEETGEEPYPHLWPAKWSPDSSRLSIRQDALSGSICSDGISTAAYDTVSDTMADPLGEQEEVVLSYNENVAFGEDNSLSLLTDTGREMALDKELVKVPSEKDAVHEELKILGLMFQGSQVLYDRKSISFAALKELKTGEWVEYPIQRQLCRMENGHVTKLTNDSEYPSEFPVLTGDGSALVLGHVDREGGMSIQSADTNGSGLQKLADLEENISTDEANGYYPAGYEDFYGRGSWSPTMSAYTSK